jgi:hypothetical protein
MIFSENRRALFRIMLEQTSPTAMPAMFCAARDTGLERHHVQLIDV